MRSAATPLFETLEGRSLMSAASGAWGAAVEAGILGPTPSAGVTTSLAARPRSAAVSAGPAPAATARMVSAVRQIRSVVTVTNWARNPANYQLNWTHQGFWQSFAVRPGQSMIHSCAGRGAVAVVRFDQSFAAGYQERRVRAAAKPFVAGGREGWTPRLASDGTALVVRVNAAGTGLTMTGSYALDTARYGYLRPAVGRDFPNLGGRFEIVGPSTPSQFGPVRDTYNCIAWSIGVTGQWVWPGARVVDFDALYARYGFRRLPMVDTSLQPGVQKICLYAFNGQCTHASVQGPDGSWTSKLGSLPLIRHAAADVFGGSAYGRPVAVYAKMA